MRSALDGSVNCLPASTVGAAWGVSSSLSSLSTLGGIEVGVVFVALRREARVLIKSIGADTRRRSE